MKKPPRVIQIKAWVAALIMAFIFGISGLSAFGYVEVRNHRIQDCRTSNEDRAVVRAIIEFFLRPSPINPEAPADFQQTARERNANIERGREFALGKLKPRDCGGG